MGANFGTGAYEQALAQHQHYQQPEQLIAETLWRDLGVVLEPDEIATFIRDNWRMLNVCAHRIHGSR